MALPNYTTGDTQGIETSIQSFSVRHQTPALVVREFAEAAEMEHGLAHPDNGFKTALTLGALHVPLTPLSIF